VDDPEDCLKIRKMVGLLPGDVGLYDSLSAYKNLDFYGKLYEVSPERREENIKKLLSLLGIWERRDHPVGTFSKGTKQKIAIARALIHDPELLFLDEPTANLDPEASKTVRDFVLDLKKEKRTIFINTHNLNEDALAYDWFARESGKRLGNSKDCGSPATC
jgi:ABC-2 type transport system ATP-binding protein